MSVRKANVIYEHSSCQSTACGASLSPPARPLLRDLKSLGDVQMRSARQRHNIAVHCSQCTVHVRVCCHTVQFDDAMHPFPVSLHVRAGTFAGVFGEACHTHQRFCHTICPSRQDLVQAIPKRVGPLLPNQALPSHSPRINHVCISIHTQREPFSALHLPLDIDSPAVEWRDFKAPPVIHWTPYTFQVPEDQAVFC